MGFDLGLGGGALTPDRPKPPPADATALATDWIQGSLLQNLRSLDVDIVACSASACLDLLQAPALMGMRAELSPLVVQSFTKALSSFQAFPGAVSARTLHVSQAAMVCRAVICLRWVPKPLVKTVLPSLFDSIAELPRGCERMRLLGEAWFLVLVDVANGGKASPPAAVEDIVCGEWFTELLGDHPQPLARRFRDEAVVGLLQASSVALEVSSRGSEVNARDIVSSCVQVLKITAECVNWQPPAGAPVSFASLLVRIMRRSAGEGETTERGQVYETVRLQVLPDLVDWKLPQGVYNRTARLDLLRVACTYSEDEGAAPDILAMLKCELPAFCGLSTAPSAEHAVLMDAIVRLALRFSDMVGDEALAVLKSHMKTLESVEGLPAGVVGPLEDLAGAAVYAIEEMGDCLRSRPASVRSGRTSRGASTGGLLLPFWGEDSEPALPVPASPGGVGGGGELDKRGKEELRKLFVAHLSPSTHAGGFEIHVADVLKRRFAASAVSPDAEPLLLKMKRCGFSHPRAMNGGSDPIVATCCHKIVWDERRVIFRFGVYNGMNLPITDSVRFSLALGEGFASQGGSKRSTMSSCSLGIAATLHERLLPGACFSWDVCLGAGPWDAAGAPRDFTVSLSATFPHCEPDEEIESGEAETELFKGDDADAGGSGAGPAGGGSGGGANGDEASWSREVFMNLGDYEVSRHELLLCPPPARLGFAGFRSLFGSLSCSLGIKVASASWVGPALKGSASDVCDEMGDFASPSRVFIKAARPRQLAGSLSTSTFVCAAWVAEAWEGSRIAMQLVAAPQPFGRDGGGPFHWSGRMEVRCARKRILRTLLSSFENEGAAFENRDALVQRVTMGVFEAAAPAASGNETSINVPGKPATSINPYRDGADWLERMAPLWKQLN